MTILKVKMGDSWGWATQQELDNMEAIGKKLRKMQYYFMTNPAAFDKTAQRRAANEDNRKWAIIKRGKNQELAWVDTETMKAYKNDNYSPTWIEIKNFTFVRWARGMDL